MKVFKYYYADYKDHVLRLFYLIFVNRRPFV